LAMAALPPPPQAAVVARARPMAVVMRKRRIRVGRAA
jgi:hypothetical protein